jgi:hypothetical protein
MTLPTGYNAEQTIKKQITITAGSTTVTSIPIPQGRLAALKGYGYTWYTSNTFQLETGNIRFPRRTDQEGSAAIPRIFENYYPIRSGGNLSLSITNGDSVDHTYDIVFYLFVDSFFEGTAYESTGGALTIDVGSSAGSGVIAAIYDSTYTTAANVTAKGLAVDPQAPATLRDGTTATTADAAVALSSTVALKKGVLVQAKSTNTTVMYVGNATSQNIELFAGDAEFIEVDDLAKVYIKRTAGGANVTANYHGS